MISVIVPVYNASKYINDCIDSILNQTYKDFELILINDGSSDNSLNIIEKYKEQDNRIKVFSQENKGVSYTRNRGIDIAKGNYLMFIDSDDWIEINALEKMLEIIEKYNADVARCNYFVNYENKEIIGNDFFEKEEIVYNKKLLREKIIPALLCNKMKSFSCLYLIKTNVMKNSIYYNEKICMLEDQIVCLKILAKINKCVFTEEPLYHYRVNPYSATVNHEYIKRNIQSILMVNSIIINFLDEEHFNKQDVRLLCVSHLNVITNELYKLYDDGILNIEYLKNLRKEKEMTNILKAYDFSLVKSKKNKISVFLLRHKLYGLFEILCHINKLRQENRNNKSKENSL